MNDLFGHDFAPFPFEAFSFQHFTMIFVLIGGSILIYKNRGILIKYDRAIRFILFTSLFVLESMYHIWLFKEGYWEISFTLPLQLCSISLILSLILLITRSAFVFQIVFFIGITGATMAVITPELFLGFPHFRFFQFFITHIAIIWTCLYFFIVYQYIPNGKGLIQSFISLNISACFAFVVNKVTGGNYMFLASKPSNASLLDYFGPFPFYIIALEGAALVFFFLLLVICKKVKLGKIKGGDSF